MEYYRDTERERGGGERKGEEGEEGREGGRERGGEGEGGRERVGRVTHSFRYTEGCRKCISGGQYQRQRQQTNRKSTYYHTFTDTYMYIIYIYIYLYIYTSMYIHMWESWTEINSVLVLGWLVEITGV